MAKGSKTGGRRPGSLNKVTVEAKEFCASIVDDPEYQKTLRRRALKGELPGHIRDLVERQFALVKEAHDRIRALERATGKGA